MIKFLFRGMISDLVAKEVAKTDDKIKYHCVELIKSFFDEDAPMDEYVDYGWCDVRAHNTVKGDLRDAIVNDVTKNMSEKERKRIETYISGESLIDSITDRINKKQIK